MAGRGPDTGGEAGDDRPGSDDRGDEHGGGSPGNGWGEHPRGGGDVDDWGDDFRVDDDGRPVPIAPTRSRWPLGYAGWAGLGPQLSEPSASTPLDTEDEGTVPAPVLWAMKYLRHAQFGPSSADDPDWVRWASLGEEDAVYVIDDGGKHCMVARPVGAEPDGCLYCLVGRVTRLDFEDVRAGQLVAGDLFAVAKELTLCSVVAGAVSNVAEIQRYRRYRDVPTEYLPSSPFIEFDGTP